MAELIGNKGYELDILIRQGATFGPVQSTLKDENQAPINLTGVIIRGQIRKSPNDTVRANAEFDCVITDAVNGVFQWGLSYEKTVTLVAGLTENDPRSQYAYDLEIEYSNGRIDPLIYGVAVGYQASGSLMGAAVGYGANGSNSGAAVGYGANGSNSGAAVGYQANGSLMGAAVGRSTSATKQYGSAIGAYSRQERYGGHARSGDHLATSKLHVEEVHWAGVTTTDTETELFLHGVSANRCILLASSVLGFTVRVTGIASTTFDVIDLEIKGTIKRDASNVTTLVGAVTSTVINNENNRLSGVKATITADNANKALKLTVTGLASTTINWGAVGLLLDRRI